MKNEEYVNVHHHGKNAKFMDWVEVQSCIHMYCFPADFVAQTSIWTPADVNVQE
jgi:hypothetical protein